MNLNIRKAYYSPFSEKSWHIKWIFPFIMSIFNTIYNPNWHIPKTVILITALISLLLNIVLWGFFVQFQHNEIHDEIQILPELKGKIKTYFVHGFKTIGIILFYLFFGFGLFIFFSYFLKFGGIIKILARLILIVGLFLFVITLVLAQSSYANDFNFRNAIKSKRIYRLIAKVKLEIFLYALIAFSLCLTINVFSKFTNIMIVFSSFIVVWMQFVLNNLRGLPRKL